MFCSNCGNEIIEGQNFCTKCGIKIIKDNSNNDVKLNEAELNNKILENKDNIENAVKYVMASKQLDQPNSRKYVEKVLKDNGIETITNSSPNISYSTKTTERPSIIKILSMIILFIIIIAVFKNFVFNNKIVVNEDKGLSLAEQYLKEYGTFATVNSYYVVGKIVDFYSSSIIKNDGNKYIFEVKFIYNPKLQNGNTNLAREEKGVTYVVYNAETTYFRCARSLETAEKTDLWNE